MKAGVTADCDASRSGSCMNVSSLHTSWPEDFSATLGEIFPL